MTYDPNRTTVMPTAQTGFPITEDLPVVRIRRRRPWLRNLGLFLLVITIAAGLVIVANIIRDRSADNAAESPADAAPTASAATVAPAPTVVTTTTEAGYWQVVGVADGLNVRSGPGTNNDVVGTLVAEQRHIFATGVRSSDGGWLQIALDDSDQVGWVSARFLAADVAPAAGEPRATVAPPSNTSTSTVCFASSDDPVRVARIVFTNRVEISGLIVTVVDDSEVRQNVSGVLDSGQAVITLTDSAADTITRQQWTFNPANIDLGNGTTLSVIDCAGVDLN